LASRTRWRVRPGEGKSRGGGCGFCFDFGAWGAEAAAGGLEEVVDIPSAAWMEA